MFNNWVYRTNDRRSQRIAGFLSRYINPIDRVLDCGCGGMRVAHFLRETLGVAPMGIDIIHLNETALETQLEAEAVRHNAEGHSRSKRISIVESLL